MGYRSGAGLGLGIAESGQTGLDNLKRLQALLVNALDRGDHDMFAPALLDPATVYWLPPIPNSSLFMTFHGNGIGNWRDRAVAMSSRRITSRVPACRLHPPTAHLGHLEPMIFAKGEPVPYGNELGVVIAPGGKDISFEDAPKHLWGIMNCDDVTRGGVWPRHFPPPEQWSKHEGECKARLARASDASCPSGPWITTVDEMPNVLDLLMYSWGPDGGYDRAHTWAYIMGPSNAVAYLSRFMTLPAGTVLQLAASKVSMGLGTSPIRSPCMARWLKSNVNGLVC